MEENSSRSRTGRRQDAETAPLPVQVVKTVRTKSHKNITTILCVEIILVILVAASLVFQTLSLYRLREQVTSLQEKTQTMASQLAAVNAPDLQLKAQPVELTFQADTLEPTATMSDGTTGHITLDLEMVNIGQGAVHNVSLTWSDASLNGLVNLLNSADENYTYTLTMENSQASLVIHAKDDAQTPVYEASGAMSVYAPYLLGSGQDTMDLEVSQPIFMLINRAVVLNQGSSLSLTLSLTCAQGQQAAKTTELNLYPANLYWQPEGTSEQAGTGQASYTLQVK